MKTSNFNGAPRTLSDSTFHEWGCAIERPPRRPGVGKWIAWSVLAVVAFVLIASGRA